MNKKNHTKTKKWISFMYKKTYESFSIPNERGRHWVCCFFLYPRIYLFFLFLSFLMLRFNLLCCAARHNLSFSDSLPSLIFTISKLIFYLSLSFRTHCLFSNQLKSKNSWIEKSLVILLTEIICCIRLD